jgi:hypothetical protein
LLLAEAAGQAANNYNNPLAEQREIYIISKQKQRREGKIPQVGKGGAPRHSRDAGSI